MTSSIARLGAAVTCTVTAPPGTAEADFLTAHGAPPEGLPVTARRARLPSGAVLMQPITSMLAVAMGGADVSQWRLVICDDLGADGTWAIPVGAVLHTPEGPPEGYPIVAVAGYPGSHVEVTVQVGAL